MPVTKCVTCARFLCDDEKKKSRLCFIFFFSFWETLPLETLPNTLDAPFVLRDGKGLSSVLNKTVCCCSKRRCKLLLFLFFCNYRLVCFLDRPHGKVSWNQFLPKGQNCTYPPSLSSCFCAVPFLEIALLSTIASSLPCTLQATSNIFAFERRVQKAVKPLFLLTRPNEAWLHGAPKGSEKCASWGPAIIAQKFPPVHLLILYTVDVRRHWRALPKFRRVCFRSFLL